MNNRNLQLDDIIKQGLKAEADKISVPPKEEVWIQISKQLERQKRLESTRKRRFKLLAASMAIFLYMVTTLSVFPGQDAKAVGKRLVQIYRSFFGEEIRTETVSRENTPPPADKTAPPDEQVPVELIDNPQLTRFSNIEEARRKIPFDIKIPGYIPDGYDVEDISYLAFEKGLGEVVLRYRSGNSDFKIFERKLPGDFAISSTVRSDEASSREVVFNGITGTITSFNDGVNELDFYYIGISIRIIGHIDVQEIIKIGQSIQ